MITAIRTALEGLGYTVHQSRQEKIRSNDIVVILDDVDVQVDTTFRYRANVWVLLEWDTTNADGIPKQIFDLYAALENKIVHNTDTPCKATFKFIQSEVNQLGLGTMYRVTITVEYVEEIYIG